MALRPFARWGAVTGNRLVVGAYYSIRRKNAEFLSCGVKANNGAVSTLTLLRDGRQSAAEKHVCEVQIFIGGLYIEVRTMAMEVSIQLLSILEAPREERGGTPWNHSVGPPAYQHSNVCHTVPMAAVPLSLPASAAAPPDQMAARGSAEANYRGPV